jgi:hypothetical protein
MDTVFDYPGYSNGFTIRKPSSKTKPFCMSLEYKIEGGLNAPVHIHSADGKLNGYVQMQQGQGLQMMVDLEFTPNLDSDTGKSVVYRLNEKRSIKLNEVYYLDHPKFGVVAKISH